MKIPVQTSRKIKKIIKKVSEYWRLWGLGTAIYLPKQGLIKLIPLSVHDRLSLLILKVDKTFYENN